MPSRSCSRVRARRSGCARRPTTVFRILEFGAPAPPIPYVRNYFKNERLYATLATFPRRRDRTGADRSRARTARAHVRAFGRGRPPDGDPRRVHGSRLLAGLLLVRSHPHERRCGALPWMLGGDDDAVRPAARRRALAGRAPDDSVHALEPGAQTPRPRRGGRDRGRQLHHRGRPAGAGAGDRRHAARDRSEPRERRGPPRHGRRVRAAAAGPVCALPRQAGAQQGQLRSRADRRAREPRLASRDCRRRPRARRDRRGCRALRSRHPADRLDRPGGRREPGWRTRRC